MMDEVSGAYEASENIETNGSNEASERYEVVDEYVSDNAYETDEVYETNGTSRIRENDPESIERYYAERRRLWEEQTAVRIKRQKRILLIGGSVLGLICILLIGWLIGDIVREKKEANIGVLANYGEKSVVDDSIDENSLGEILQGDELDQETDTMDENLVTGENLGENDAVAGVTDPVENLPEESQPGKGDDLEAIADQVNQQINPQDYVYETAGKTYMGSEEMTSTYGLLVNVDEKKVVADKEGSTIIVPASMTKILTILTAADYITDVNDTFQMNLTITDYAYRNDCSSVGFSDGEVITVQDMLYGTILPSGADAALGLATYVAGSHEAFVELMNKKLEALGLSDTAHFTNCAGLYDENHYCSLYDMAAILDAAMKNDLCREVLSTKIYTTSKTSQHPEGITVSNWFLRRIEDKDCLGEVVGAKTGFVVQSRNCAASYYTRADGTNFICVTADAHSSWRAIYDHVAVYNIYAAGNTGYKKN